MDVEEEGEDPRPPDLQPHEDPNSDIGPTVDEETESPSWLGSDRSTAPTGSATDSDKTTEPAGREPLERSAIDDAPNPLVTLARQRTAGLVGSLLAVVVVGGLLVAWSMGVFGSEEAVPTESPAVSDPAATQAASDTAASPEPQRPPPANLTLGETLHLTVVAETDVTGIRVRRDNDLRRPYWIEAGEATVFPFSEQIIVEQQWEAVDRLLLEGYSYPLDRRNAAGRLVLTREEVEAFADTLRGAPAGLSITPDTAALPSASPQPSEPVGEPAATGTDTTSGDE